MIAWDTMGHDYDYMYVYSEITTIISYFNYLFDYR